MPAFVGPVELIESSGIFTVGDTFSLAPKSSEKSSFGSGVGNSGDFIQTQNLFSITRFEDVDIIDQADSLNM